MKNKILFANEILYINNIILFPDFEINDDTIITATTKYFTINKNSYWLTAANNLIKFKCNPKRK